METKLESQSSEYSWERTKLDSLSSVKSGSHLWSHNTSQSVSNRVSDDLFLFGYSCKLFRDDSRAQEMDCGKHLIPWMGSESHLIDRFDVRGCLHDLSQYEPNQNVNQQLTDEELEIERLCNEERFADLKDDDDTHDEEIKRLHEALADGKVYNQMSYNYSENSLINSNSIQILNETNVEEVIKEEGKDSFKIPTGLCPPQDISLPCSQKLHNIIEKTASFVSKHGTQMEIIVKTKQSSNKNFEFLSFDSPLNPYYKFLLSSIKAGKYTPKESENSDESDSDGSGDEHYLHPSLLGSNRSDQTKLVEPFNIPNLLRSNNDQDLYSQLVKSFKDKFPYNEENIEPLPEVKPQTNDTNPKPNHNNMINKSCSLIPMQNSFPSLLPSPPSETELIIEKLAQHVAKKGEQFEQSIKSMGETKFEFVNPGNIYHAFYIKRKLHYLDENRKAQAAQLKLINKKSISKNDCHSSKTAVSFSISVKEAKNTTQMTNSDESVLNHSKKDEERSSSCEVSVKKINENALKDKLAYAARDRVAKEKQLLREDRKRKIQELLRIKGQEKELKQKWKTEAIESSADRYGPDLPKPKINDSQQLSPTITAVTSPDTRDVNNEKLIDLVISHKSLESVKCPSILPFIASDKPLKESSILSPPHRHHRSSSHRKSYKRNSSRSPKSKSRNSSKSRSPSCSRSPSHSHRKHRRESSKSKSRSRSRSHSRSHKRH